jgi:hypothetical protein
MPAPFSALSPHVTVQTVAGLDRVLHRFFDTSPFSPSGRYLALTRLPFEDRLPAPGDVAEVWVADLETGGTARVAESRAWDTQLGAQVQWGASDDDLYFNDLEPGEWLPFAVRADWRRRRLRRLDGPVYVVAPDGRHAVSPNLNNIGLVQPGYGAIVPPAAIKRNRGAAEDDGIWITDTETGKCRLLVSLAELVDRLRGRGLSPDETGDYYGFHLKWNPQGDRLMYVLRWHPPGAPARRAVLTLAPDRSEPRVVLPADAWARGGHHPNWCPDGRHIAMNLRLKDGEPLRFVRFPDGDGALETLVPELSGSGHPTLHPDGRHLLTDAYPHEAVSPGDGTAPLRWIDLQTGQETRWLYANCSPPFVGPRRELRVDPHPAWDRTSRRVALNAWDGNTRRVLVVSPRPHGTRRSD